MKFYHLKIVNVARDARKWSAKWRKLNISDILIFEFNIEATAVEAARNICAVYGDNAIEESMEQDRFYITDTPLSGRLSVFDEDRLNLLTHNDQCKCTRELLNVMNCDHSTIVRHFIQWARLKKSGVGL